MSPAALRKLKARALCAAIVLTVATACNDVGLSPSVPASLEFANLPAPALVIGDTLRNVDGVVAPARAVVRNQAGEELKDVQVYYTYADANRDSALLVDSTKGFVIALKALTSSFTSARIAARVGSNLQAIRTVLVTTRPDSADRIGASAIDTLRVSLPDTGSAGVSANTTGPLSVTVRHIQGTGVSTVPNWLVKYEVVRPPNPTNDSTKSVFLVNDVKKLSNIDTTDATGIAQRFVRVRASQFPVGAAVDSAVVLVTVSYRGQPVKGAPIRIVVPVIKKP